MRTTPSRMEGYLEAENKTMHEIEEVLKASPNRPFNTWQLGHLDCYIDRVQKAREDLT